MKILIISHFFPYPFFGGGGRRFQALIKVLQERHEITFVTFIYDKKNEEALEAFRNEWRRVEIIPIPHPGRLNFNRLDKTKWILNPCVKPVAFSYKMKEAIENLIKTRPYDIVQFEYAQTGQYLPYFSPPSILVEHDIISLAQLRRARAASGLKRKIFEYKNWFHMKRYERDILSRFDKIVTMSEVDKEILMRTIPELDISVVPNGVDTSYYKRVENNLEPRLTFMAGIKHYANTDAAEYFIRSIWPLIKKGHSEVKLYLVGNYPMEECGDEDLSRKIKDSRIIWTGLVEDTRPYLAGSIFIAPIRIASGTRLKILEAMASGCAVISTRIGAEGIQARHGEEILIADTPSNFAGHVLNLLKDHDYRKKIGQGARALVKKKYDWEDIIEIQEKIYKEVRCRYGKC